MISQKRKVAPLLKSISLQLISVGYPALIVVDSKLTSSSNLVYNCKYGKVTNVKILLLFEHKSYPETYPHLQLLGYILKIWEVQIKQKENLTPVIPIFFYHGKQKWKYKQFEKYFIEIDETIQKFIPKFEYQIVDTSNYTDEEIHKLFKSLQLQIGILVMKNIFNDKELLQKISTIFAGLNQLLQTEQGEQFFEIIVAYLLYATKIDTEKYVENMRTISHKAEGKFISTVMRLQMKGKMEGIRTGIEKGYSNQIIIDATNLKEEEVEQLKRFKNYHLDLETV